LHLQRQRGQRRQSRGADGEGDPHVQRGAASGRNGRLNGRLDVGRHGRCKHPAAAAAGAGERRARDQQGRGRAADAAAGRGGGGRAHENRIGVEGSHSRGTALLGSVEFHARIATALEVNQVDRIAASDQVGRAQGVGRAPPAVVLQRAATARGVARAVGEIGPGDRKHEAVVAIYAERVVSGLGGRDRERSRGLHDVVAQPLAHAHAGKGVVVAEVAVAAGIEEVQHALGLVDARVLFRGRVDHRLGVLHAAQRVGDVCMVKRAGEAVDAVGEPQARGTRRPGGIEAGLRPRGT